MSLIPDYLMEFVIDYLGRYVAGEHRAAAKHWTLLPRATTFVQCSRHWQTDIIAETIDKVRLEKVRSSGRRPSTQVAGRCELCLLALDEDDYLSQHEVGLATIVTFTRACQIPYNTRTLNYFDARRLLVRLNLCFMCSLEYWTKWHCEDPPYAPSTTGSSEGDEEDHSDDAEQLRGQLLCQSSTYT